MTEQELIQECIDKLFAQGALGQNNKGVACYWQPNGCRCAVGVLVSEEEAKSYEREFALVEDIPKGYLPIRLIPFIEVLSELQSIHDASETLEECLAKMQAIREC